MENKVESKQALGNAFSDHIGIGKNNVPINPRLMEKVVAGMFICQNLMFFSKIKLSVNKN